MNMILAAQAVQLIILLSLVITAIISVFKTLSSSKVHATIIVVAFSASYLVYGGLLKDLIGFFDNTLYYLINHQTGTKTINSLNYFGFLSYLINILPFFLFWIIASLLMNAVSLDYRSVREEDEDVRFSSFISPFFEHPTVAGVLTISIFLFSLYLVLASIVCVPEFQIINKESDNSEKFTNEFQQYLSTISSAHKDLVMTKDSLTSISNKNDEKGEIKNRILVFYTSVELQLKSEKENLESQKSNAINQYRIALNNSLSTGTLESYRGALLQSVRAVANNATSLNAQIDDLNSLLYDYKADKTIDKYIPINQSASISFPLPIPDPPIRSDELGFVGLSFQWLLATRSPSIALIVGLIGFGLLGAIGSRFIKDKINYTVGYQSAFSNDIVAIIITGVSSAIVVFVGVKGSIAVLTNNPNSNELNPYAVFFLCFVASIFSEQAWLWAREKFSKSIIPSPSSPQPQAPPPTPAPASPSPQLIDKMRNAQDEKER